MSRACSVRRAPAGMFARLETRLDLCMEHAREFDDETRRAAPTTQPQPITTPAPAPAPAPAVELELEPEPEAELDVVPEPDPAPPIKQPKPKRTKPAKPTSRAPRYVQREGESQRDFIARANKVLAYFGAATPRPAATAPAPSGPVEPPKAAEMTPAQRAAARAALMRDLA